MSEINAKDKDFLRKIIEIIEEHISNELFGVSELARETGMSRSILFILLKPGASVKTKGEKSIAVLPFKKLKT